MDNALDERAGEDWLTEPDVRAGYPIGVVVGMGRTRAGDMADQGVRGVAAAVMGCGIDIDSWAQARRRRRSLAMISEEALRGYQRGQVHTRLDGR